MGARRIAGRSFAFKGAAAVVAAVGLALALPAVAGAHAFLIRSDPPAGARLTTAPKELTLFFSEPFVRSSEHVTVRSAAGPVVSLPRPESRGTVIHQPLPSRLEGVFVVSWRVLADDGHVSLGEFAFAVGSGRPLPTLTSSTERTPASQVIASWLFFLGLSLSFGGLASERFVWRSAAGGSRLPRAPVFTGLSVAVVGAFVELALVAGGLRGGGLISGLHPPALVEGLRTRPGLLTVAILAGLAIATGLAFVRSVRPWALVPLVFVVVATALRGHGGTSGRGWAVAADAVHLAGAALWLGALAHLILVISRSDARRTTIREGVHRYSQFAFPTALVILVSGVVSAFAELRRLGDLTETGYGRTLIVKTLVVGCTLLLALSARRFALRRNPGINLPLLRVLTRAEGLALVAVVAAAALLVNLAPPRDLLARMTPSVLGHQPLRGPSLRLGELAGQLVVGLAAAERELQFVVVPPGNASAVGATLTAEAERPGKRDADLFPRPCGPGCFTIRFDMPSGTTMIKATASMPGWAGGEAVFRVPWPLQPEDPDLLGRVVAVMRRVPELSLTERVSSGPGSVAAPTGYRLSGKAFLATEPFQGGAVDVRALGRSGGLTEIAFALPGSSVWYRLWIDAGYRIRREQIVSTGHLILRTFEYPPSTQRPAVVPNTGTVEPAVGPFVSAREADDLAVGLAVAPGDNSLALTASVFGPDGRGVDGLTLGFVVHTSAGLTSSSSTACGSGCYRASILANAAPRRVTMRLARVGRPETVLSFALPSSWPPVSAATIAARATRVFRSLHSVVYEERLASSNTNAVYSRWTLEAPNRLTYAVRRGSQAVIIAGKRWDREPGGFWARSTITPLPQPEPFWITAPNHASLLGSGHVGRRPIWIVTFVQPSLPAWFTLSVDKETFRPLELRMVAPAHFMHHRYFAFNRAPPIRPPP